MGLYTIYCYICGAPLWMKHGWLGDVVLITEDNSRLRRATNYDGYGGFTVGRKLYEAGTYVASHLACSKLSRAPHSYDCLRQRIDPYTGKMKDVDYGEASGDHQFPEDYMAGRALWVVSNPNTNTRNRNRILALLPSLDCVE